MIEICVASDVPEGDVRAYALPDGRRVAVYHVGGDYFATDDLCTHGDASLSDGEIEDGSIVCPFHGGAFCIRTGVATAAPCHVPIRTYRATVDDGRVLIDWP